MMVCVIVSVDLIIFTVRETLDPLHIENRNILTHVSVLKVNTYSENRSKLHISVILIYFTKEKMVRLAIYNSF